MYWIEVRITHRSNAEIITFEVDQRTPHRDPLPAP